MVVNNYISWPDILWFVDVGWFVVTYWNLCGGFCLACFGKVSHLDLGSRFATYPYSSFSYPY